MKPDSISICWKCIGRGFGRGKGMGRRQARQPSRNQTMQTLSYAKIKRHRFWGQIVNENEKNEFFASHLVITSPRLLLSVFGFASSRFSNSLSCEWQNVVLDAECRVGGQIKRIWCEMCNFLLFLQNNLLLLNKRRRRKKNRFGGSWACKHNFMASPQLSVSQFLSDNCFDAIPWP